MTRLARGTENATERELREFRERVVREIRERYDAMGEVLRRRAQDEQDQKLRESRPE